MAPGFHVENFGCRASRADGEAVAELLRIAGLADSDPAAADVVVVNTCSVTEEADRAARAFIRRAHCLNPEARIVATGCYAQRAPEELSAIPGVAAVVGNSHKAFAPEIALGLARGLRSDAASGAMVPLRSLTEGAQPLVLADDRFAHSFLEQANLHPGIQTRPNLKIQEGCGNRCSFCVIPQTRGGSRSLSGDAVLSQVRSFVAKGGNELVLSGINLGRWGRDLDPTAEWPRPSLAALVGRIMEGTGLPRLRLSSIEPMDWDEDLIGLMREFCGTRIARHAHLPLQSGSDTVLRRMHRRYRPWHYAEKVAALVEAAGPELTLGADVMVGFPGETDHEFDQTLDMVRALPFGYLHLFPFSPRPGTRATLLHAQSPVSPAVVDARMAELRSLAAEKSLAHWRQFMGHALNAITLNASAEDVAQGKTPVLTENFIPIELDGLLAANRMLLVHVAGINEEGTLLGTVASSRPSVPDPYSQIGLPVSSPSPIFENAV